MRSDNDSDFRKELPEMESEAMDGKITGRVASRARVQRYRGKHRRIDYAPSAAALALIERHLIAGLDTCWAGVIDRLIAAGSRAISENGNGQ